MIAVVPPGSRRARGTAQPNTGIRSDGERDKEASGGIRLGVVSPCPDREHRRTEWLSLSVYWLGPTLVIALSAITVGLASPKGWARPTAISLGAAAAIAFVVVTLLQIG